MRRLLIAGNWKMNCPIPQTEELINGLLRGNSRSDNVDVLVCPAYPSLQTANKLLAGSHIKLGAQDMSAFADGAYTAEVSADMLLTVGCQYVILGHSERRQYHAESDETVNIKAKFALDKGLNPIICVGETLEEREADRTEAVVGEQLKGSLVNFTADMLRQSVIAYEPVWAIGTGKTASPQQAQDVHAFIRAQIGQMDPAAAEGIQILYGGSVKPSNATDLLGQPDIDGALVGGASLQADVFCGIINPV